MNSVIPLLGRISQLIVKARKHRISCYKWTEEVEPRLFSSSVCSSCFVWKFPSRRSSFVFWERKVVRDEFVVMIVERTIKGDAQFLHTLPFVVDYFGTVAKIKEQSKPPAEVKEKTQLYCTEIDLYDQTKVILTGYEYEFKCIVTCSFFVWRKMSVIE